MTVCVTVHIVALKIQSELCVSVVCCGVFVISILPDTNRSHRAAARILSLHALALALEYATVESTGNGIT